MTLHSEPQVDTFGIDQRRVHSLALLGRGYSYREVQAKVGITRSTLYRWRKDPAFIMALHTATQGQVASTADYLDGLVNEALELLAGMVRNPDTPQALRALAANAILEHHRKPIEPPRGRGQVARSSVSSFIHLVNGLAKAQRKAAKR